MNFSFIQIKVSKIICLLQGGEPPIDGSSKALYLISLNRVESTMHLYRSIVTVGGFTFLSRVTGFIRDALIAGILGVSGLTDAFFVAFKLPNFFRRFFAEGAFNAAFIPLFLEFSFHLVPLRLVFTEKKYLLFCFLV